MVKLPIQFPLEAEEKMLTLSQHEEAIYIIEFHNGKDNRLTWEFFIDALFPALDIVESIVGDSTKAALITVSKNLKFYSNGLDLESAMGNPRFFNDAMNVAFERFLTFPIPCIAAITGHAFAGGFMLASAHDYRIMNKHRGYLCLNELEFGAPIPAGMAATVQNTMSQYAWKKTIIEAYRWNGQEAFDERIVHGLAEKAEDVLPKAIEFARTIKEKSGNGSYGILKRTANRNAIESVKDGAHDLDVADRDAFDDRVAERRAIVKSKLEKSKL